MVSHIFRDRRFNQSSQSKSQNIHSKCAPLPDQSHQAPSSRCFRTRSHYSSSHIQVIKTRLHAITVNQSRTAQLRSLTHNLEVRLNHLTLQASNLRQASIRGHNSRRQGRWELVVPALENRIAVLERSIEELGGELRKKVQECVTDIGGRGMAPQADMFGLKRDRQEQIENDEEDDILAVGRPRKRLRHE